MQWMCGGALRLALTIGALIAVAAAPAGAQEPRRGGTLVFAVLGDPPTLDCHAASSFATTTLERFAISFSQ